jgi:hypothetical protein
VLEKQTFLGLVRHVRFFFPEDILPSLNSRGVDASLPSPPSTSHQWFVGKNVEMPKWRENLVEKFHVQVGW